MIPRFIQPSLLDALHTFSAVALLGPRQVGKTTLAHQVADSIGSQSVYLDLERPSDLAKMREPELYLESQTGRLVILDEIQRIPDLFAVLRSLIDARRRAGEKTGQFLLLGSASLDLLKQSSESLAGRLVFQELAGLSIPEILSYAKTRGQTISSALSNLWLRGGFPDSFLALNDAASFEWRQAFIRTYLERDIPQFGSRVPAETLRRFWTMLAHQQGSILNASALGTALSISSTSIQRYLDLLVDLLLIRRLQPWFGNVKKRLVKSPKLYIRDTGLLHALLHIKNHPDLMSHPVVGNSWEGFVIENILNHLPKQAVVSFYRTLAGAEIDLVIELGQYRIAIEVKRSLSPKVSPGFHLGCDDIQATHRYLVYPGEEAYALPSDITVTPVQQVFEKLSSFF